MAIHLIMPMAGEGSRFVKDGFDVPKPLLEIQGEPFFYWATQSVRKFVELASLTFVVLERHVKAYRMDEAIRAKFPEARLVVLPKVLNGAVLSALAGVAAVSDDAPILLNDCDHIFTCHAFYAFCQKGAFGMPDGALLTFDSIDPKFSFAQLDAEGNVVGTVEKQAVSRHAICGAYYFRNRSLFETASEEYLHACAYKEYFVSGVYNVLAAHQQKIRAWHVDMHLPFGTPEEYEAARVSRAFEVLRG